MKVRYGSSEEISFTGRGAVGEVLQLSSRGIDSSTSKVRETPRKMVGAARGHQRADTALKPDHEIRVNLRPH